jgi:hypothetical protein
MGDNAAFLAGLKAKLDAFEPEYPEGSPQRAVIRRMRELIELQLSAYDAAKLATLQNALIVSERIAEVEAEMRRCLADVASLFQEAGEDYDRALIQDVLDGGPPA